MQYIVCAWVIILGLPPVMYLSLNGANVCAVLTVDAVMTGKVFY